MLFSWSLYPHIKTFTPLALSNHHTLFPSFPWNECPSHHRFSCSICNCQQCSNLQFPCLYPDRIFPPFLCQAPVSWLSQHHPGSMLAPLPSAPSGRLSALPLNTHTLHVSAELLGPGNHSLGSGARCFRGQAGTKWQVVGLKKMGNCLIWKSLKSAQQSLEAEHTGSDGLGLHTIPYTHWLQEATGRSRLNLCILVCVRTRVVTAPAAEGCEG